MFLLCGIEFINDNTIHFTDFSIELLYQQTIYLDTVTVGAISNLRHLKQQTTPIHLVGRSNKYTKFDINAGITPFDEIENYHLKGDFKEFSLPAVSSYMRDASGLEIKTGQLDIGFEFKLAGDQLNGNVNVLLGALETGIMKNDEVGNLIDQGRNHLI